ncbi:MAG: hypothetical protein ABFS35_22470 [Bacteroidota bacterium]
MEIKNVSLDVDVDEFAEDFNRFRQDLYKYPHEDTYMKNEEVDVSEKSKEIIQSIIDYTDRQNDYLNSYR